MISQEKTMSIVDLLLGYNPQGEGARKDLMRKFKEFLIDLASVKSDYAEVMRAIIVSIGRGSLTFPRLIRLIYRRIARTAGSDKRRAEHVFWLKLLSIFHDYFMEISK